MKVLLSNSKENNYSQTKQYLSERKMTNLFYIKSKHTQKYFHNHPYFAKKLNEDQSYRVQMNNTQTQIDKLDKKNKIDRFDIQSKIEKLDKKPSLINQNVLKAERIQSSPSFASINNQNMSTIQHEVRQFVDYPTEYGIDNTYNYLKSKSFLNQSFKQKTRKQTGQNLFLRKQQRRYSAADIQDIISDKKSYMKDTMAHKSKFIGTLNNKDLSSLSFVVKKTTQLGFKRIKTSNYEQQQLQIDKSSTSLQQIMNAGTRNVIYNTKNILRKKTSFIDNSAKYQVQLIFGKRLKSFSEIPYRTMTLDISSYLINTFLKCKINYKQLVMSQFQFIKDALLKVLYYPQHKYDTKDIINMSSMKNLMTFIRNFSESDEEWAQIIRYFFLSKQPSILDYQFQRFKQQVTKLMALKFQLQFGHKNIYIFQIGSKKEITNLYDMFRGGRFLIGQDRNVMNQYQDVLNYKKQTMTLNNKVKKWKSIALSDQNQTQNAHNNTIQKSQLSNSRIDLKKVKFSIKRQLTEQKYNNLFDQFKLRQLKRLKKTGLSSEKSESPKKISQFIQRSKLKKQINIFQ